MRKAATLSLCATALIASAVCHAQAPPTSANTPPPLEEVTVSVGGLYGDWRMVLPEWPGIDKPVTGDFCDFKKRDDGVSISCADGFLDAVPQVTLDGDNHLRMRWGGPLNHTIYDATWMDGAYEGEIVQAQMGLVAHRIKANMERVPQQQATDAPQSSLTALNDYLAKRSAQAGFNAKYFGKILEQKGDVRTFPDVFKVSDATGAEQWCLVLADVTPADIRCRNIP
ncbi:MAG TPA: hypothetical protein VHW02_01730 [Rhizomicrobium sp.]|jgi:hypothetical protein|nr:hypothetical protein [Rhizomicrobium sp.]